MEARVKVALASLLIGASAIASIPNARAVATQTNTGSLTCQGTIHNRIDFTVNYQQNRGFYRAEFRPKRSTRNFYTELRYTGINRNRRGVWHGTGTGNIDANVALVHLSTRAPQRGDRVSIAYDGQWGRGICR